MASFIFRLGGIHHLSTTRTLQADTILLFYPGRLTRTGCRDWKEEADASLSSKSPIFGPPFDVRVRQLAQIPEFFQCFMHVEMRGEKVGIPPEILHSDFEGFLEPQREYNVKCGHSFLHESLLCFDTRRALSVPVVAEDEKCSVVEQLVVVQLPQRVEQRLLSILKHLLIVVSQS